MTSLDHPTLTNQERQAQTIVCRPVMGWAAPTGKDCEFCGGSCCDWCQWTGLQRHAEEIPNG